MKNRLTIPRPPALLTAEASSAYPTHCMPPWTTGTIFHGLVLCHVDLSTWIVSLPRIPSLRVKAVLKGILEGGLLRTLFRERFWYDFAV